MDNRMTAGRLRKLKNNREKVKKAKQIPISVI